MRNMGSIKKRAQWDPVMAMEDKSCTIDIEERLRVETDAYSLLVKTLRATGTKLRSDQDQPIVTEKPRWFNEILFNNAKSVYERHFMGINFAHLSGLLLLVRVDSIYRTLSTTGESSSVYKLFKRYYHTLRHVKTWYESSFFEENSDAHRSLLIVRGMHNKVSSKFNDSGRGDARQLDGGVHLSEYDIMITQFAFVGFIVIRSKNMGLLDDFSRHDLDSLLHFWRVIGYYLGASDKFNLCSYELKDIVGLCEAIMEIEYKESLIKNSINAPPGVMSLNIIRSVSFIPMLTIYGMLRYLYEILGHPTDEIEYKQNWYSVLSHTLINLVMTKLLAYKPLRAFNNGLTRLSIFLVGKVDVWFARRLESKYGHELKV